MSIQIKIYYAEVNYVIQIQLLPNYISPQKIPFSMYQLKKFIMQHPMTFYLIRNYSTKVAKSPSSWIDDYFDWLNIEFCCHVQEDNVTFCPSIGKFYRPKLIIEFRPNSPSP